MPYLMHYTVPPHEKRQVLAPQLLGYTDVDKLDIEDPKSEPIKSKVSLLCLRVDALLDGLCSL